jgi:hypothetical protein
MGCVIRDGSVEVKRSEVVCFLAFMRLSARVKSRFGFSF